MLSILNQKVIDHLEYESSFNLDPELLFWKPSVDIYRRHNGLLVKVELAGVHEHEFKLHLSSCYLEIYGHRRDKTPKFGAAQLSMEIQYSKFYRRVELPNPVDSTYLEYHYEQGMLYIDLVF